MPVLLDGRNPLECLPPLLAPSITGALGTNGITVYAQYVALQSLRNDPLQGALRDRSWHLALRRVETR